MTKLGLQEAKISAEVKAGNPLVNLIDVHTRLVCLKFDYLTKYSYHTHDAIQ